VLKGKDGTLLFREGEGESWLEGVLTFSTSTGWWEADVFSVPEEPAGDIGGTECGQPTMEDREHVGRFRVRLEQDDELCAISQVLLFGVPGSEEWSEDNVVRAYPVSSQRTPPAAMAANSGGGAAARASTSSAWPRESPDGVLAAVPEEEAPPQLPTLHPPLEPPLQPWQPPEKPPGVPSKAAASTPLSAPEPTKRLWPRAPPSEDTEDVRGCAQQRTHSSEGQIAGVDRTSSTIPEDLHQAEQTVSRPAEATPCDSPQPPAPPSAPPMPLAGPPPLPPSPLPAGSDPWTTWGSDPWSKGRSDTHRTEPPVAALNERRPTTDSSVAHRMIMSHLGSQQRAERKEAARLPTQSSGQSTKAETLGTEGQRRQEKADSVSLMLRGTQEALIAWLTQKPDESAHRKAVLRKAMSLKLQVVRQVELAGGDVEAAITQVEAAETSAAPSSRDEPRSEWQERGWWSASGTWEWSARDWGEWAKWQCEGGTWIREPVEPAPRAQPAPEPAAVVEDPPSRAFQ